VNISGRKKYPKLKTIAGDFYRVGQTVR